MSAPSIRKFKAWEDRQPGSGGPTLHVSGEVQIGNSNETPVLSETVPQGINPAILMLDLSIQTSGVGTTMMDWKPVKFEKKVKQGQHTSVDILWKSDSIAKLDVEIVH